LREYRETEHGTQSPATRNKRWLTRLVPLVVLVIAISTSSQLHAQPDSAHTDTIGTRHWYDTLTVTKPRYARVTTLEHILLSGYMAFAIPVSAISGALTIFPPSINLLVEENRVYPGLAISTGLSFGGDSAGIIWFPDVRVQPEIGWYFGRRQPVIARMSVLHDFPITSIHRRDFYYLAAAGGAGVGFDGANTSLFAEAWFGIANPSGIRFIGLYPMHNFGVRVRAGYDLTAQRMWIEPSLAATATFWW
jgi:hypothetical protein